MIFEQRRSPHVNCPPVAISHALFVRVGAILTVNLVKFLHPIEDTNSQNPYFVWRQIPVWIKERVSFLPGAGPLEKLEKLKVRDLFRFLRM